MTDLRTRRSQLTAVFTSLCPSILGGCAHALTPTVPAVHCRTDLSCTNIESPALTAEVHVHGSRSHLQYPRGPGRFVRSIWARAGDDGTIVVHDILGSEGIRLRSDAPGPEFSFTAADTSDVSPSGAGEIRIFRWIRQGPDQRWSIHCDKLRNDDGAMAGWSVADVERIDLPGDITDVMPCNHGAIAIHEANDGRAFASLHAFDGHHVEFTWEALESGRIRRAQTIDLDRAWLENSAELQAIPGCTGLLALEASERWETWMYDDGPRPLTGGAQGDLWHASGHNGMARIARESEHVIIDFWYVGVHDDGPTWVNVEHAVIDVSPADQLLASAGLSTGTVLLLLGGGSAASLYRVHHDAGVASLPLALTPGSRPGMISSWSNHAFVVLDARLADQA